MNSYATLRPDDLAHVLGEGLRAADAEIDAAIGIPGDGVAVMDHLDRAARHALGAFGRSAALWTVHQDEAMREASGEALTRYEQWRTGVLGRPDLYSVLTGLDRGRLAAPDARRVDLWRGSARAAGAHLDDTSRSALQRLHDRVAALTVQISQAFVQDLPLLELTDEE